MYGNYRLTPTDIPSGFGLIAGVFTARFAYHHQLAELFGINASLMASFALIQWRANTGGGKFLDSSAALYHGFAASFYFVGLLMAAVYYLVYGN